MSKVNWEKLPGEKETVATHYEYVKVLQDKFKSGYSIEIKHYWYNGLNSVAYFLTEEKESFLKCSNSEV